MNGKVPSIYKIMKSKCLKSQLNINKKKKTFRLLKMRENLEIQMEYIYENNILIYS